MEFRFTHWGVKNTSLLTFTACLFWGSKGSEGSTGLADSSGRFNGMDGSWRKGSKGLEGSTGLAGSPDGFKGEGCGAKMRCPMGIPSANICGEAAAFSFEPVERAKRYSMEPIELLEPFCLDLQKSNFGYYFTPLFMNR